MPKVTNHLDILPYEPRILKNRTEIISLIVGSLLFILGLSGLPFSHFMGLHLSVFHCLMITIAGVILFWNGYLGNHQGAFWSCFGFGTVFGVRGILAFLYGQNSLGLIEARATKAFGHLSELGIADIFLDAALGIILLIGAYDWRFNHKKS